MGQERKWDRNKQPIKWDYKKPTWKNGIGKQHGKWATKKLK